MYRTNVLTTHVYNGFGLTGFVVKECVFVMYAPPHPERLYILVMQTAAVFDWRAFLVTINTARLASTVMPVSDGPVFDPVIASCYGGVICALSVPGGCSHIDIV